MSKIFFSLLFNCFFLFANAQTVEILQTGIKSSMRGLSVVNDKIIWVSGSNGTVGKSLDGGATWKWFTVKGFEKNDFRDIEAFDKKTAIIMSISDPAYILKTTDGGETWTTVFEDHTKGMFLDAMYFWNGNSGIVVGDPISNKMFIGRTFDGGKHWQSIPPQNLPVVEKGEACFASSGTNITGLSLSEAVFVTGGMHSRLFIRDKKMELPIIQGKETTGANAVAVKQQKKQNTIIVVGGDFNAKDDTIKNCCITIDEGKNFTAPQIAPHGYRSCVEYLEKSNWISCGLNGVDFSDNDGQTWNWISKESFHVCKKAKKGKAVFFAGNGKVGRLK